MSELIKGNHEEERMKGKEESIRFRQTKEKNEKAGKLKENIEKGDW